MGIKDPYHRLAILVCVEELKSGILISDQAPATTAIDNSGSDNSGDNEMMIDTSTSSTSTSSAVVAISNALERISSSAIAVPSSSSNSNSNDDNQQQQQLSSSSSSLFNHRLIECSFSSLESCDKCKRYLRGVLHQGLQCEICNLIVHRTCVANGLMIPCNPSITTATTTSNTSTGLAIATTISSSPSTSSSLSFISSSPPSLAPSTALVLSSTSSASASEIATSTTSHKKKSYTLQKRALFGLGLCQQFNPKELPAPTALIVATKALETQAEQHQIDLYKLYKSSSTVSDELNTMKDIFNSESNMSSILKIQPQQLVAFIKKFLRELKDPVIPMQWYDNFIVASSKFLYFKI